MQDNVRLSGSPLKYGSGSVPIIRLEQPQSKSEKVFMCLIKDNLKGMLSKKTFFLCYVVSMTGTLAVGKALVTKFTNVVRNKSSSTLSGMTTSPH